MMIILKIILSALCICCGFVIRELIKDYKAIVKTEQYENLTVIEKIKMKAILYISIFCIIIFLILLAYFIITPIEIKHLF